MIQIKQKLFILSVTIIIICTAILTTYFNKKFTPDKKLEKIIEQQEEIESEFEELDIQNEEKTEETEDEISEQVRFYLSDKLNQAIQFFFTNELNIVALGDSLTQGVGDPTNEGGYIGILDRMINKDDETIVQFINYGKRGSRTNQLLNLIDEDEIKEDIKQADIILITIGANDIMQVFKENFTNLTLTPFVTEEVEYEIRLKNIFTKLRQTNKNAQIYLLGFYNPFGQYFEEIEELDLIVSNWNDIGKNMTESLKEIQFIPIKDLFEDDTNTLLADDFFHPNYEGYRNMAERVLHHLIEEDGDDNKKE